MKRDLLFDLIEALTILPGVGKKSAQRMALYLLDKNKDGAAYLGDTLKEALENVQRCKQCRILTSDEYCRICSDSSRDHDLLKNPSRFDNTHHWLKYDIACNAGHFLKPL